MVRWPGTVKPGTSELPWAFWDVLPTVQEGKKGRGREKTWDSDFGDVVGYEKYEQNGCEWEFSRVEWDCRIILMGS